MIRNKLSRFKRDLITQSIPLRYPSKAIKRYQKRKKPNRNIYIDCGANTGQVLSAFLKNNKGYDCHAFEPQPELSEILEQLIAQHTTNDITLYKQAVWIKDEPLSFYLATEWDENYKGGSTLLSSHTHNLSKVDYNNPVTVQAIDFTDWFLNVLKATTEDYIVIKMDIEGAEYPVLEKMIEENAMPYVSELIIEFHHQMSEDISISRHKALVSELQNQQMLKLIFWH